MTRDFPTGGIRVSDAERDRAIAELSEHFQTGRLTREEFDDRSGLALRARTGDDLRELFTDLPRGETAPAPEPELATIPAPAPVLARGAGRLPAGRVVIVCVLAAIVIGNVTGAVVGHGVHQANVGWIVPVVILLIVLRRICRR